MITKRQLIAGTLILLSLCSFSFATLKSLSGSYDLGIRWKETRILFSGGDIYDPIVIKENSIQPVYFPSSYLATLPVSLFDLSTANFLWLTLNLLFTWGLARLISVTFLDGRQFFVLLFLTILSSPWRTGVHVGQLTLWSLYFFMLSIRLHQKKNFFLSGFALAAALVKYTLIGPMLLYFLLYKQSYKNVGIAAGLHIATTFALAAISQKPISHFLLGPIEFSRSINLSSSGYADLYAFFSRLGVETDLIPHLLAAFCIAALAYTLMRKRGTDDLGALALCGMVSTVLMYHRSYDYLVVIFVVAWLLRSGSFLMNQTIISAGVLFTAYVSFHFFYVLPNISNIRSFMLGNGYLTFVSLTWYLAIVFAFIEFNRQKVQKQPT